MWTHIEGDRVTTHSNEAMNFRVGCIIVIDSVIEMK